MQINLKNICFSVHFDFNKQFIKVWELGQYFKNTQKNYFVFF